MPTAGQIVAQVQAALPAMDPARTGDVFHAGDPGTPATGVVVTFQATRAVCEEAVRLGANLIITHEPTFYVDGADTVLADDPVFNAKRQYIADNGLCIWRCHDAWHRRTPDGILTGVVQALGWTELGLAEHPKVFRLPQPVALLDLIGHVMNKLQIEGLRYIGDPSRPVQTIAISCGCPGWLAQRALLRHPGVDALLCGEVREWETNEYVRDHNAAVPADQRQALVVLGHRNSEEAGMRYLADWLRPMLPGVAVTFVPCGDPFTHA